MKTTIHQDWRWWLRYGVCLLLIVALNARTLYTSWRGYYLDGSRIMGWPVTFIEQSYFLGTRVFPHWLILDAALTLLVPKLVADVTRDGLFMLFHRARTWGTPWEGSEPTF